MNPETKEALILHFCFVENCGKIKSILFLECDALCYYKI